MAASNVFVEQLVDDIKEYIEGTDLSEYISNGSVDTDELAQDMEDSVTDSPSGSYTASIAVACDNIADFFRDGSLNDFHELSEWFADTQMPVKLDDPEYMDVCARLCFFPEAFDEVVSSDWFDKTVAEFL